MGSKQHVKLAIGVVVIVTSVAYLIFSGATRGGGTMYFLTVPEVQHQGAAVTGQPLRVAGKVTDDPIEWDMRRLSLVFVMGEAQARLPVRYSGVKPDMFQPGVDVIVEGRLGRDGVFVASVLMTSCPSKYQDDKGAQKT